MGQEISTTFEDNIGTLFWNQHESKDTITYCDECKIFRLYADEDEVDARICESCEDMNSKAWQGADENVGVPRYNFKSKVSNHEDEVESKDEEVESKDEEVKSKDEEVNEFDENLKNNFPPSFYRNLKSEDFIYYCNNHDHYYFSEGGICECKRLPSRTYKKIDVEEIR
jgi:hypothetical protein